MAAMLDEDLGASRRLDMGMGAPLAGARRCWALQPGGLSEGVPLMQPAAALPEAPYTGWQIAGLAVCAVLLMLCGMMMYDLLRNMWSWAASLHRQQLVDGHDRGPVRRTIRPHPQADVRHDSKGVES